MIIGRERRLKTPEDKGMSEPKSQSRGSFRKRPDSSQK